MMRKKLQTFFRVSYTHIPFFKDSFRRFVRNAYMEMQSNFSSKYSTTLKNWWPSQGSMNVRGLEV